MPSVKRPGMVGVYVELPEGLRDRARAFAAGRGEQFADVVRLAIERHLAYPPAPPVPPPPPVIPAFPDAAAEPTGPTPTPAPTPSPAAVKKPRKKPAG